MPINKSRSLPRVPISNLIPIFVRGLDFSGPVENWEKPSDNLNFDGENLLVYEKQYENVFIGVQSTFGYEEDPMRMLFFKSASPHHGFATYYSFVEKIFQADAALHFGTHGSHEFMCEKQVGMSDTCYSDSLIGNIPNVYYYAANNPSEATIAKHRSLKKAETVERADLVLQIPQRYRTLSPNSQLHHQHRRAVQS